MSASIKANPLREEFLTEDEEYRYAYAEDFLNTHIATQIKVLRDQRVMTQEDLANAIGTKQSGISRLENVNYSAWKTDTLRRIARAFGVRLKITFETFGSLLNEDAAFSRKSLERPKFADDPAFKNESLEEEAIPDLKEIFDALDATKPQPEEPESEEQPEDNVTTMVGYKSRRKLRSKQDELGDLGGRYATTRG